MNGAESLVRTLVGGGVDVCFSNPGTSEMHFVAALDRVDGMRCVLALFEGVATGAADGYARMAEKPAATLAASRPRPRERPRQSAQRHEGRDAGGEHRRRSRDLSPRLRLAAHLRHRDRREAVLRLGEDLADREDGRRRRRGRDRRRDEAARAGRDADPSGDTAWDEGTGPAPVPAIPARAHVSEDAVKEAARVLRSGEPAVLLLTGLALREKGLELAGAHRRQDRHASCWRRPSTAAWSAARARLHRAHSLSGRSGAQDAGRRQAHRAGRQPQCRWRSSPIRTSRACWRRRTRSSPRCRRSRRLGPRARMARR